MDLLITVVAVGLIGYIVVQIAVTAIVAIIMWRNR